MGQRKDIGGSTGVPTFYGSELRWKRLECLAVVQVGAGDPDREG